VHDVQRIELKVVTFVELVHLHRSFYAIEAPVIYLGYETTTLYPTLD